MSTADDDGIHAVYVGIWRVILRQHVDPASAASADPHHDEYLLASMVQGIDGALVGFASLVPGLINDLLKAVKAGDLNEAMRVQDLITPLKDAVYGAGEPTGEAHGRMKAAMALAGILRSGTVRPPTHAPGAQELDAIRLALAHANLLPAKAA